MSSQLMQMHVGPEPPLPQKGKARYRLLGYVRVSTRVAIVLTDSTCCLTRFDGLIVLENAKSVNKDEENRWWCFCWVKEG